MLDTGSVLALTPSKMVPLNFKAPDFKLPDTDGVSRSLDEQAGEHGTLVMFISNHCPYVIHLKQHLAGFGNECLAKGLGVVAINSNDTEKYPADHPIKMAEDKLKFRYPFPYLFDESQEVARAYEAACTPDFFLFDRNLKLAYRGQFDDSRPGSKIPVTGDDLRKAIDLVVAGKPVPEPHKPSIGCNIKWKS